MSGHLSERAAAACAATFAPERQALVALARSALSGRFGVRAARSAGFLLAAYFVGLAWLLAGRRAGALAEGVSLSIASRGVLLIAVYAGGIAALSLSRTPKSPELDDAVRALAMARGVPSRAMALAETTATVRLGVEVVGWPSVALVAACFVLAPAHPLRDIPPMLGAAAFGLLSGGVGGAVAAMCRRAFGRRGRTWLLALVLLPWIAAGALVEGGAAEFLSIPGWLSFAWRALTNHGAA